MAQGLGLLQFVLVPPLVLLGSILSLVSFQNFVHVITPYLSVRSDNVVLKALRPFLTNLRLVLNHVLGKNASFKITFSHVLMMAIVLMLLAVYNAIQKSNELQAQRLRLAARKPRDRDREEY